MSVPLRFSLVVATLGRVDDLAALFDSLLDQAGVGFEVIVVDQNPDDRLAELCQAYQQKMPLQRLRAKPGASAARNLGLAAAKGEIVGFPDDDCTFPPGLLEAISQRLSDQNLDGFCFRATDKRTGAEIARFANKAGPMDQIGVWTRVCMISLFVRRAALVDVGGLSEDFGPGPATPWKAAEDFELPLRLMARGYRLHYDPALVIHHPNRADDGYREMRERARIYAPPVGRLLRMYRFSLAQVAYHLARPLGGVAVGLVRANFDKAAFHATVFWGRLKGYLAAAAR